MSNRRFRYPVESCPHNKTEFNKSAARLKCGVDKNGRNRYICLPNENISAIEEFCYERNIGLFGKGNCLYVKQNGFLEQVSCLNFSEGCPEDPFLLSDLYKFPACHEINRQERCFRAEPGCPKSEKDTNNNEASPGSLYPANNDTKSGSVPSEVLPGLIISGILVFIIIAVIIFWKIKKEKNTSEEGGEEIELLISPDKDNEPKLTLEQIVCFVFGDQSVALNRFLDGEGDYSVLDMDENDRKRSVEFPSERKKHSESTFEQDVHNTIGDYNIWKTNLSAQFHNLSSDEKSVLFCLLCSDSSTLDFNDKDSLLLMNVTRWKTFDEQTIISREKAQETLERLESSDFIYVAEDGIRLTGDAEDEIMYCIVERSPARNDYKLFLFSFSATRKYFRTREYLRKPGEKCLISPVAILDSLIIRRLQMDVLTHVTMEDINIFDEIFQILNVPDHILKDKGKRYKFASNLEEKGEGEALQYRSRSVNHVQWLSRYWRPNIVRSCIGLFPHCDIYIMDNKAYRRPSKYHRYAPDIRCLIYCLLLVDKYTAKVNVEFKETILKKVGGKYFTGLSLVGDVDVNSLTNSLLRTELMQTEDGRVTFLSDRIRHDVMYAFVTECLVEDSDLEFFLNIASRDVISEYCRSWKYKRGEEERCLYIPDRPRKFYNLFIEKLQFEIITHCTISDRDIHLTIHEYFHIPLEILRWDHEARERYLDLAKRETQVVHHARGMIVGCAEAGKTTLLKRLLKCSKEEIEKVMQTKGLEVHEELFEISDEGNSPKATLNKTENGNGKGSSKKTLTFFDFGGQCAYYACHQIYLTRRAFYIIVVDASKPMDRIVDKKVCDQKNSVFSEWTYGDYFLFWMKSIHTYCETESAQTPNILIVATHWENARLYKNETEFIEILQKQIPRNSLLLQYIRKDSCFFLRFPIEPIDALEKQIVIIASQKRWKERIPKEWICFEIDIHQRKDGTKIMSVANVLENEKADPHENNEKQNNRKKDMLRYFHDAGKILYFNEEVLNQFVIIDVQWFVDAFKHIITDKLHLEGIPVARENWDEYYETGLLRDNDLTTIWKCVVLREQGTADEIKNFKNEEILDGTEPNIPHDAFYKPGITESLQSHTRHRISKNPQNFVYYKKAILDFMQRLGLVAYFGEFYYIPCMNRKQFDEGIQNVVFESNMKSSILIFKFEFLPYFFFFRLVVACMQKEDWKVLKSQEKSCLYRNVALFSFDDHHIVIAVNATSIQLQIYQPVHGRSLDMNKTRRIQAAVEKSLTEITTTFHRTIQFVKGLSCKAENEQSILMEIEGHFMPSNQIKIGNNEMCPSHQGVDRHFLDTSNLTKYWNMSS